jgi:hypothetical protein
VTHPYRERPAAAAARAAPTPGRLDLASVGFGLACALVGQALAGPACALVATVVGVLLLLRPPPRR